LVKYTGLIFDTATKPKLLVPEDKRTKSLAMIEYAQRNHKRISRLAHAVVVGVLESLVEATPTRISHTYLRHLQNTLHPLGWDGVELPVLLLHLAHIGRPSGTEHVDLGVGP
jgi:hypothetical protein